jgi:hypothetical protein
VRHSASISQRTRHVVISRPTPKVHSAAGDPNDGPDRHHALASNPVVSETVDISRSDRIFVWIFRGAAAALIAYWVEFFTSGRVRTSDDRSYLDFERAFLLADGYTAAVCLLAGHQLARGRPEAVASGVAAGSAAVFLGCMDLLYDLQHDKFREKTPEMALEKGIVAASLILGPITMVRMWRARRRLGA